jgi:hypothetical protein
LLVASLFGVCFFVKITVPSFFKFRYFQCFKFSINISRDMDKLIQWHKISGNIIITADVIYFYLDISKYKAR